MKYCPQGSVFTAFCCPWLSCHSRGIVRVCGDRCCNLHSFLIKQWSVQSMKLASKEVTSRADGILWLKRSPWHNVLTHTYPFFVYTTNSSAIIFLCHSFLVWFFLFFSVKPMSSIFFHIYFSSISPQAFFMLLISTVLIVYRLCFSDKSCCCHFHKNVSSVNVHVETLASRSSMLFPLAMVFISSFMSV